MGRAIVLSGLRSSWRLRLTAALVVLTLAGYATRDIWRDWIGRALVCDEGPTTDVLLVDNFDVDYRLFKRAAELQRAGVGPTVIIPVVSPNDPEAIAAERAIAMALANLSGLSNPKLLEIREAEPISLNAAYQIRDALVRERATSVAVITPGFRSQRSRLIYEKVLGSRGFAVSCVPVWGQTTVQSWTHTWHGIQDVGLQFLKLQYYRFWVLPWVK